MVSLFLNLRPEAILYQGIDKDAENIVKWQIQL